LLRNYGLNFWQNVIKFEPCIVNYIIIIIIIIIIIKAFKNAYVLPDGILFILFVTAGHFKFVGLFTGLVSNEFCVSFPN
jgi:hypothetical protein